MMKGKDSSGSKGYAFVTFRTKEIASRAIEELNNSELKVLSTHLVIACFPSNNLSLVLLVQGCASTDCPFTCCKRNSFVRYIIYHFCYFS